MQAEGGSHPGLDATGCSAEGAAQTGEAKYRVGRSELHDVPKR